MLIKSFLSLSFLTALSRISGFVKIAALAAFYGRSVEADIFMAVMLLPDLLYKFLSEGLVSCAAIPMFADNKEDKKAGEITFFTLFWLTLIISLSGAFVFAYFANFFCELLFPGIAGEFMQSLTYLWAVITLYLVFVIPAAVLSSFLNTQMSFALPAVGPLIVNAFIILGIFLSAGGSINTIVYFTILGAIAQLVWLCVLIKRSELISFNLKAAFVFDKKIAKDFVLAISPVAIWVSSLALIPVYERYLLSMQTSGSLAALNYVEKLFNLPLGIISISIASVILPKLSLVEPIERKQILKQSLFFTLLLVAPVVIISWLYSDFIVEIVYKRGQFSLEDATTAAGLFKNYALALLPVSLSLVLNRGFFAAKKYFFPFIAGLLASITIFIIGTDFIDEFGIGGLGYAATLAYTMQAVALFARTFL